MIGLIEFIIFWGAVLYVCWWGLGALELGAPWHKLAQILLVAFTVIVALEFITRAAAVLGAPVDLGLHIPR